MMRDRLIELMQEWGTKNTDSFPFENVADHLLANGVIVPPCKVGSEVYYIKDSKIQALRVDYGTFGEIDLTMSARCKDEADMCEAGCWLDGKTCGIRFDYSHIGKTVFLTKELAEEALRKEQANNRRTCLNYKSTKEEAERALKGGEG